MTIHAVALLRTASRSWLIGAGAALPGLAQAHSVTGAPLTPQEFWHAWNLNPWLLAAFAVAIALYGLGLHRLWGRAGRGHGIRYWQAGSHACGMAALFVALISPLDPLGEALSAAHMLQHMLLMILAAPLLVLGQPLAAYIWALPPSWRRAIAKGSNSRWVNRPWHYLTRPLTAWALYGVSLWLWHAPALYEVALRRPLLHDIEHASFLGTALLFWWVVFRTAGGVSLLLLFTTLAHGGLLAALMTFSSAPWYAVYADTTSAWGLTPLEDQQLAGLIMWLPGGIAYLTAALGLLSVWLGRLDRARPESAY